MQIIFVQKLALVSVNSLSPDHPHMDDMPHSDDNTLMFRMTLPYNRNKEQLPEPSWAKYGTLV